MGLAETHLKQIQEYRICVKSQFNIRNIEMRNFYFNKRSNFRNRIIELSGYVCHKIISKDIILIKY